MRARNLGRSTALLFLLLLLCPTAALALPSTATITGTLVRSNGGACGGCNITIQTEGTQVVGGSSFPDGIQRSWKTEADGDLPAGVTSTRGLWVKISLDKADPFTVQIPASSSVDLATLVASAASPPAGGSSADITAVWTCSSGDCSAITAGSGDSLNAEAADSTAPCKSGTSAPATCQTGDCFFDTDATAGSNMQLCTATDTWTTISGGGGGGNVSNTGTPADNQVAVWTNATTIEGTSGLTFSAGTLTATTFSGALSGNASTATALASNPSDCAADTYATSIAASGNLTCASITNASTTGTALNTPSTLVLRDGSGNFAAGTITAALTGNASTATALAADPADCGADTYATTIAASGALTCSTVTNAGLAGSIAMSKTLLTADAGLVLSTNSLATASAETGFIAGSSSLPGTCGEGAVYQDTDSGGTETYVCTATNTWTKLPASLVIDARDYGVVCDSPANTTCGANGTDNTAFLQAAVDAAATVRGTTVVLPTGVCRFSTLDLDGIDGTTLQGQGAADSFTGTTLCTSTTNAVVVNVTKPRQFLRDLSITTGGTPTSGQVLLHVNTANSSLYAERVFMDNFYEAIRADDPAVGTGGAVNLDWVNIVAQVDAAHALYLGSVELRIDNTTITSTATMSSALVDIDAELGRVDTVKINNTTINMPVGKTGPSLWIHRTSGSEALQWIQIANSTFEGDPASTDPVIKIDAGNDVKITSTYVYGGKNGVQINGGAGIGIVNSNIFGAGEDCVSHTANAPTWLVGTEVTDCSGVTSMTDSGVKLGASSRGFTMTGGRSENSGYVGNTQKYGIECVSGASAFSVQGVDMSNNGTAEQLDCSPPTDDPARWSAVTFQDGASGRVSSDVSVFADIDFDNSSASSATFCIRQDGSASCSAQFIEDSGFYVWNNKPVFVAETTANGTDTIGIQTPASLAASWTLTLPPDNGNANDIMCNAAGDGVSTWCAVTSYETALEGVLDLQDLQGAVTDTQVPNTITVDLATTATTANAGDSATSFFPSGELERTLLPAASADCSASNWAKGIDADLVLDCSQPAFTDISGTAAAAQITKVNATSCASGVQTASDGTVSCLTASATPEYVARVETAGGTLGNYAVVMADGSDDDEVIEATTTATQILGCSQDGNGAVATDPVEVAMAGVARCKADTTVVAGSLVKLGASGEFALATTAEKTWGRAVTDDDGAGSAYILLFDGAEGFIDHKLSIWPSVPDVSANTNMVELAPTVDITGAVTLNGISFAPTTAMSNTGTLAALNFSPSFSFSAIVDQLYGLNMVGTVTSTNASALLTASILRHDTTYTSATASAEPLSSVVVINNIADVTYTATSGSSVPGSMITTEHNPTVSINSSGGGGSMTLTNDIGLQVDGTYTETAGTLAVTNRIGFKYNEVTNTGSNTAITNNIGADFAALSNGSGVVAGIRNADKTVFTPGTQAIAAATDTITCTATSMHLTTATGTTVMSSNPTVANGTATGDVCILTNVDATATDCITFTTTTLGLRLGAATRVMCPNDALTLYYNGTDWIELAWSDNT